jgi:uncharacterized membrane protein YheB (UPF0754 family)
MIYWLVLFPFLAAFAGWFFAWAAVQWYFHPSSGQKSPLPGEDPPAFQRNLADRLSKLASEEFLSPAEIEEKMASPENLLKIMPEVEIHIDHFLRVKLKEVMPVVGMLIGDRTILQLKGVFMDELRILFPVIMKSYSARLQQDINMEEIIRQKLLNFPAARLKALLYNAMSGEIRLLKITVALSALVTGLIQLIVFLFFFL